MHVVSGLIRKAPLIKQLQESVMFVVELSEMVKDFKTGEKTYTNYKAFLFAKSQGAIEYYTQATAEGSYVVLNSEKLKVETFDANSGKTYITLMMDNARLESAHFDSNQVPQQQYNQALQQVPQQQYNQAPQQAAPAYQQPPTPQQAQQQAPQSWGTNQQLGK